MKKVSAAILLILVAGFLLILAAAPVVNDRMAEKTADRLLRLPLPDHTELVETVHKAGKLVGNGNGMQYFGAMLIKSKLSLEELKEFYLDFAGNEWECIVEDQADAEIKAIEHTKLTFKTDVKGEGYYIVYSWGDNNTFFHEIDIRGH